MAVLGLSFLCEGFSPAVASGGHSSSRCTGLSLSRPLPLRSTGSRRGLSNCGSRAQPLRGMRDPPRPGLEPVSPALAGRLPTTAPPRKPQHGVFTGRFNGWNDPVKRGNDVDDAESVSLATACSLDCPAVICVRRTHKHFMLRLGQSSRVPFSLIFFVVVIILLFKLQR